MIYSVGVWGGTGGKSFSESAADTVTGGKYDEWINRLHFRCADIVDGIQLGFKALNGTEWASIHHGGTGGRNEDFPPKLALRADEFIVGITGNYGGYHRGDVINHLTIYTNKGYSLQFGGYQGSRNFGFTVPDGYEICGFYGYSGTFLDSIGVFYRVRR